MLIIRIEATESGQHYFESQSHRTECWLEGWVAVPEERAREVLDCRGYGNLIAEDGRFVDFTPRPDLIPVPEKPESDNDSTVWDELDAAYQEGVDSV